MNGSKTMPIDIFAPEPLAITEQMWHIGPLQPFPEFERRVRAQKEKLAPLGIQFGPASAEEADPDYSWE